MNKNSTDMVNKNDILIFGSLIFFFTITEAFLFKELPLTILILLSVVNLLIYAIYDIKRKEIKLSWEIYLAGALTLFALIAIYIN